MLCVLHNIFLVFRYFCVVDTWMHAGKLFCIFCLEKIIIIINNIECFKKWATSFEHDVPTYV